MESTLVIKVRYADTLRRFNAVIREDGQLALNLEGLRAKVLGLFNFPPDAVIGLTYVDEDGDVVTLVDDSDLQDVTRQNLKFLRVDVSLKTEKDATSYAASSCSSTPLRSPATERPSTPNVGGSVADVLKTLQPALSALPPTVAEAVAKFSTDFASKAAASGAQFKIDVKEVSKSAQQPLYEALSKMSLDLASNAGSSSAPVLTDLVDSLSKIGLSYISTPQEPKTNATPQTKDAGVPTAPSAVPDASRGGGMQEDLAESSARTRGVSRPSKPVSSAPVDLNRDPPIDSSPLVESSSQNKAAEKKAKEPSAGVHVPTDTVNPWGSSCPFSGVGLFDSSYTLPHPLPPHFKPFKPFKRSHSRSDGMVGLFHRGVQCDGCGIHPIAGPRYKSTVKENYDLCCMCFAQMGNETDYVKMDKPATYRHSRSFRGSNCPASAWTCPVPLVRPITKQGGSVQPRLDSRFVLDVNVVDGTVLAPSTPFTKIWRLRNNGNLVWPKGTQLVWIGGDRFNQTDSSELEIAANGLPVDEELDVAIDFTSPAKPGRYISYWRLVSPSGTKFGQRIWVLIHVDASLKVASGTSLQGFNLNLPPVSVAASDSPQTVVDATNKPAGSAVPSEVTATHIFDQLAKSEQEKNFPVNDALLVGNRPSPSETKSSSSYLPYPMIDLSDAAAGPSSSIGKPSAPAAIGMPKPTAEQEDKNVEDAVEESLLKELEEMGFKQVNLNKEILRMNEYDLDQSLDDLCGVAEWDPILEELKEMGFCDNEVNKKLLKKNNGSIKRVVMDLLTGEKA
ncbi:unnamed protein product [Linum tenue]|uniref:Uncharacterized protein n=1 Tax=Linum tenue TaxID=586396 RepID=A0AAV0MZ26_9ROSI|nr:unnamed protein product [Linum tenue]